MRFRTLRLTALIALAALIGTSEVSSAFGEELPETVVIPVPTEASTLSSKFYAIAKSDSLKGAGIVIQNLTTKEMIYQSESATLRAPASVLKLISMTTTLTAMNPDTRFSTKLYSTDKPNKFLLVGEGDPWLTTSIRSAKKNHRAYLPYLINKIRAANPKLKAIQLDYVNVFGLDLQSAKKFYGRKFKIYPKRLSSANAEISTKQELMGTIASPPISEMVKFTILWSDNQLANRLAYLAAGKLGLPQTADGVQAAFSEVLKRLGISSDGIVIRDGNGLSHETRVSAMAINDLLIAIRSNPLYQPIYDGLPLSGKSGTLRRRFTKDAPNAVGLIKAKTGWIDSTVSLAGYLKAGTGEYVFTIIDSDLPNKESVRAKGRIAIDRLLAALVH